MMPEKNASTVTPAPATRASGIEILSTTILLEGWSKVVRIAYRLLRRDGTWQQQDRDMLDRGDGVTVLLYHRTQRTVLLLRQARVIAVVREAASNVTVEVCNGQVEPGETPMACALREVEQETGYRLRSLAPVGAVYASPGASLEIVHLFFGHYEASSKVHDGGGLHHEGEDIEVIETPIDQAMSWMDDGTIRDARSILVLQQAALKNLFA